MLRYLIAALCLLLLSCGVEPVERRQQPIIGGRAATEAEIRSTVALVTPNGHEQFCSGTSVAPEVVVTAAHCVVDYDDVTGIFGDPLQPADLQVMAGRLDVSAAPSGAFYDVRRIVVHPGFPASDLTWDASGLGQWDDIALLLMVEALPVASAAVLEVGQIDTLMPAGTTVLISGYGLDGNDEATAGSGVLMVAETPFLYRSDHELWVGSTGLPDHCPGDSGGPTYLDAGGELYLVGATSRGGTNQTFICGEGGVVTSVPAYATWIRDNSEGLYPPTRKPGDKKDCSTGGPSGLFVFILALLVLWRRQRK